ncbi:hypothetical protein [Mesobacillus maritimus]|nr:hypothetical protein [Mesobacillus maritimus]
MSQIAMTNGWTAKIKETRAKKATAMFMNGIPEKRMTIIPPNW